MVITVRAGKGVKGKLDLSRCTSWVERHPKKTFVIYLHRTKKGVWVAEHRYVTAKYRSRAYVISTKSAALWLIDENHALPDECVKFDDRIDINECDEDSNEIIVNLCLNCMRIERSLVPLSDSEEAILSALGAETLLGLEIAKLANRPFNSHFRAMLARLVASCYLEKVKGRKGYRALAAMS